ncbi:MAG: hypothetical protein FWC10_04795 [Lentimicrobiaceae bacterium]|nr:hypothetical protein [Lentimicrobiaceae bacterium]
MIKKDYITNTCFKNSLHYLKKNIFAVKKGGRGEVGENIKKNIRYGGVDWQFGACGAVALLKTWANLDVRYYFGK